MSRSMNGINGTGDVFLAGGTATAPQTFTGFNQFDELTKYKTTRPQLVADGTTSTPTNTDFITKQDGEDLFGSSAGNAKLDGGEFSTDPQIFTGFNQFDEQTSYNIKRPQLIGTANPTTPTNTDFITKADGEALFTNNTGDALLDGGTEASPQTFVGFNKFDELTKYNITRPQLVGTASPATPNSTDFITKADGEALFTNNTGDALLDGGTEASPQTFAGFNKFDELTKYNITRPKLVGTASPATPASTDFITKADGEALFTNNTGDALLDGGVSAQAPQVFTGFNEFEKDIVFEGGITQKDTGSVNLLTQTAVGSTLNIFSQSGVNSAASTNFITQVGSNSSFNTDGTIQANGNITGGSITTGGNLIVGGEMIGSQSIRFGTTNARGLVQLTLNNNGIGQGSGGGLLLISDQTAGFQSSAIIDTFRSGVSSNTPLIIKTQGVERMNFRVNSNITIGSPIYIGSKTYINNYGVYYQGSNGAGTPNGIAFKWRSSNSNVICRIDDVLDVIVGVFSDRRVKRNIKSITPEISRKFLDIIKPRSYNSANYDVSGNIPNRELPDFDISGCCDISGVKPDIRVSCACDDTIYGGVAQEIEEHFPELVNSPENDGIKSLKTESIVFMTISSLQLIDKNVKELNERIAILEAKVNNM